MTRMRNYFDMSDTDTRIHISFKFSYFIEVWEGPKHTKTFIFEDPPCLMCAIWSLRFYYVLGLLPLALVTTA